MKSTEALRHPGHRFVGVTRAGTRLYFVVRGPRIMRDQCGREFFCAQSLARVGGVLYPIPTANYSVSLNSSRRAA